MNWLLWFWKDAELKAHVLVGDKYEECGESRCLPGLELAFLVPFLDAPSLTQAIKGLRAALAVSR